MIDRQQLESILGRRFPGATLDQIAAAANAIMGLDRESATNRTAGKAMCVCGSDAAEEGNAMAPRLPSTQA